MREIEIEVFFSDKNGAQARDKIVELVDSGSTENEILTWASDLATEWFYNIAQEEATTYWNELGGGTDYEFENFFDKYLETCNLEWTFKKRYCEI